MDAESAGRRRIDPVDAAHLTGMSRPSPPIHRYPPAPDLTDLVDRYWVPVWDLDAPQTQSTLQHPVCLVVVTNSYARFYGVARGCSSVTLEGRGWAIGTMLTPAAGRLVLGASVATVTDRHLDLRDVATIDADRVVHGVRTAMEADPADPRAHATAIERVEESLRPLQPVDRQGHLVNEVVAWLRDHPDVSRVAEVAEHFALSERSLQRLVEQRVGLTPKWLIQRRRLHDAVQHLKAGDTTLSMVAAELGYADQAHFTHDFRTVTGMTPGEYLADQPPTGQAGAGQPGAGQAGTGQAGTGQAGLRQNP